MSAETSIIARVACEAIAAATKDVATAMTIARRDVETPTTRDPGVPPARTTGGEDAPDD